MITNSRAAIKEPREIGKKHPGKTYLPRFLDNTDLSTLKSSIDQELSDIAMHFEQDRQVVSKIVPGSDFKGIWDACTKVYPKAEENSTWDVAVTCGTTVEFDGKVWETGQQLIYLANPDVYVQRTNPVIVGIKTAVEKLEVEVANAKSSITDNKTAIAETNFAFAEADRKLQSEVDGNKASIQITNTTVADLTQTVASNLETLRAEYKSADSVLDGKIVNNSAAIETNKTAIANTKESIAKVEETLRAEYKAADSTLNGKITSNSAEISSNKQAIANTNGAMASLDTRLQSEIDGNKAGISNAMSTIATVKDGVTNLESKWTVQANVNGHISGIEMVNNGLKSSFTVLADEFKVINTAGVGQAPFTVKNNKTTFTGGLDIQDQGGNVGMKITNSQILIYDEQGRLRVKIGRL